MVNKIGALIKASSTLFFQGEFLTQIGFKHFLEGSYSCQQMFD